MIVMGVIGSDTFRLYTENINKQRLFPEVSLQYLGDVREGKLAHLRKKIADNSCDILLVGHADYSVLHGSIDVPCYTVSPSVPDFVQLHGGIRNYDTTAVLLPWDYDPDLSVLEQALRIRYKKFRYYDEHSLEELFRQLKEDGFTAVIGGHRVVEKGSVLGFEAYYYFRQVNLEDAVRNAMQICRNLEQTRLYTQQIRGIIENAMCGAIYLSGPEGYVSYVNQTALTMLQRSREDLVGRKIAELVPKQISGLLQESRANDLQFHLCGVDVIGNLIELPENCRCLLFENTARILQYETMIRREQKRKNFQTHYTFSDIVGESPLLVKTVEQARRFAQSDSTVLINAETGAGKEIFAQSIHDCSCRRMFPFVAINCAAIPDNLIESELFGYAPGAFTGASAKGKPGLMELANHGTVFLDDIDSLSSSFQAKLLRVMQEKEIIRVGGDSPTPVDVRFIIATNRDLKAMIREGAFRNDLYYRVNVLHLTIPPLRSRREDVPALYRYYLQRFDPGLYGKIEKILPDVLEDALYYDYPGNVRELISVAERFVSLADPARVEHAAYTKQLLRDCLEIPDGQTGCRSLQIPVTGDYSADIRQADRLLLEQYQKDCGGNRSLLAKKLGISRTTLYHKLKESGSTL